MHRRRLRYSEYHEGWQYAGGYKETLEDAGAMVIEQEKFGTYQGEYWFKVRYKNKTFWVRVPFGSCTICDPIQGDLKSQSFDTKKEALSASVEFGERQLMHNYTQEEAVREVENRYHSDEKVEFLEAHAIEDSSIPEDIA